MLTQISAFWFQRLAGVVPNHCLAATAEQILTAVPALVPHRAQLAGRAMLVKRTQPIHFECVVRGYLAGSGWKEYRREGSAAGSRFPRASASPTAFRSPSSLPRPRKPPGMHHRPGVLHGRPDRAGPLTTRLRELSLRIYREASGYAAARGILIADTKFEFGLRDGEIVLADEDVTPDSSRFWPADRWTPGGSPPSFDKQFLRDWLESEVDKVAKLVPFVSGRNTTMEDVMAVPEFKEIYKSQPHLRELIDTAAKMEGTVRNAGTHAAGVVISDKPILEYLPLHRPTSNSEETPIKTVTQFEMGILDSLGMLKVDFLGLITLTVMAKACALIEKRHGIKLDLNTIPLDDPKTYALLNSGKTVGVFQLESGGMQNASKLVGISNIDDINASLRAARFLADKPHGLFGMEHVLGLS